MTVAVFTPPDDPDRPRARWEVVLRLLRQLPPGGVVTYARLGDALDLDPVQDRHAVQRAVQRAGREHLEQDRRAVEAVPRVGYRVVTAPEQLRLGAHHQDRSRRTLVLARDTVTHVDQRGLTPDQARRFDAAARGLGALLEGFHQLDVRQENLERVVDHVTRRQDRTDDEVRELRERLARLEDEGDH